MDDIPYEPYAFYIFDKGYYDLARLYTINTIGSYFVIRQKSHLKYEIVDGEELLDEEDNVLLDQTIRLVGYQTKKNYPSMLRRIVYYAPDLKRTFTFLTNNFIIKAKDIAMLYKQRWQVELFFYAKYILMQSRSKSCIVDQLVIRQLYTTTLHNNISVEGFLANQADSDSSPIHIPWPFLGQGLCMPFQVLPACA